MKRIILASASPRRRQLLEQLGLNFEVRPSNHKEDRPTGAEPHQLVKALSAAKAAEIARQEENAAIVISADTVVQMEKRIMGKPQSDAEAIEMLTALNGQMHTVITGFTVMDTGTSETITLSVETTVHMRNLSKEEIASYVKSGEPLGKAGAYAIQGLGAALVEKIEGDFYNVVGLPVFHLIDTLRHFGIRVL